MICSNTTTMCNDADGSALYDVSGVHCIKQRHDLRDRDWMRFKVRFLLHYFSSNNLYFKSSTCENTFDNCISYSYDNRNEPALVNGLAAVARHSSTSKSPSTRAAERKRRGSGKGLVLTKFCRNFAGILAKSSGSAKLQSKLQ